MKRPRAAQAGAGAGSEEEGPPQDETGGAVAVSLGILANIPAFAGKRGEIARALARRRRPLPTHSRPPSHSPSLAEYRRDKRGRRGAVCAGAITDDAYIDALSSVWAGSGRLGGGEGAETAAAAAAGATTAAESARGSSSDAAPSWPMPQKQPARGWLEREPPVNAVAIPSGGGESASASASAEGPASAAANDVPAASPSPGRRRTGAIGIVETSAASGPGSSSSSSSSTSLPSPSLRRSPRTTEAASASPASSGGELPRTEGGSSGGKVRSRRHEQGEGSGEVR
jgi:hypothetical protein